MAEIKLPRLLAAAKEFNIGQETLIDFLADKGFSRDELKPTAKLTEAMYRSLQQGFQNDKVAKNKADQIEIPKNLQGDKKRKEEELSAVAPTSAPASPLIEKQEPVVVAPPPVEEPVIETPKPVVITEEPKEVVVVEAPKEKEEPVEPQTTASVSSSDVLKIEAPEIEGPKIINKINLSDIDSSTRPKKGTGKVQGDSQKKKEEDKPNEEVVPPVIPVKTEEIKEEVKQQVAIKEDIKEEKAPVVPVEQPTITEVSENNEPVIENIKAEKLEGPKILGKIELPINSDTRPKPISREEKRKRKRIPVDKKGSETNTGNTSQGNNRPPRHGQNQGQGGSGQGHNNTGGGFRPHNNNNGQQQRGGGGNFQHGQRSNDGRSHGGGGGHHRDNRFGNRPNVPHKEEEIDQKKIQDKIRETQAKLSGGGSGRNAKNQRAKLRREKRQEMADAINETDDKKLQVTEFITVSELSNLMDVSFAEIIGKCMSLGIMVSINQRLDAEVIELVAGEFGYEVEFIGLDDAEETDTEEEDVDDEADLVHRPPIVTIMGHVDHGKTSLLDYIRSANVVAGEAGGITQHIGAYVVTLEDGKKITFLDTPGHEAFTAMRARGAKVTDIAVIVVAADDAVMPQTKEAISHAQAAGVPMIFAVNKIDKDGANPQKIYEQLSQMNILVEEWGGKFQSQELSAKKGLNVNLLLEKILLEAEILDLKANPDREATGSIIEASLDKGRGYVATILVQNGTLKQGDIIVSGQYFGRVKAMFNERNQRLDEAPPSTPVQILGLNGAPQAGEKFKVYEEESEAKEIANKRAQILREQGLRTRKHITLDEIGRRLALGNFKELNIIIKGDVDGSVEALSDSLQKLSTEEIVVSVVHKAVGQISESDVLLATASDAIIIGFNVRASSQAGKLAENEGVQIKSYSIIYNAIEEVKSAMEGMLEPKVQEKEVANVEIREVYKFDKATVAGSYVLDGKIKRDNKIRLFRDGILIYPRTEGGYAELGSLKRFKDDVKEVNAGYECGLTLKNFADIQAGDIVVAYEEEEIKRTL